MNGLPIRSMMQWTKFRERKTVWSLVTAILLCAGFFSWFFNRPVPRYPASMLSPDTACKNRWRALLDFSFHREQDPKTNLSYIDLKFHSGHFFVNEVSAFFADQCSSKEAGKELSVQDGKFVERCSEARNSLQQRETKDKQFSLLQGCFEELMRYRYLIANKIVGWKSLRNVNDPAVLDALLYPVFFEPVKKIDHKRIAEVSEALRDLHLVEGRDRRALAAARLSVQARWLDLRHSIRLFSWGKKQALHESIQRLENLSPSDPVAMEVELSQSKEAGDWQQLRLDALQAKHKKYLSSTGDYYLAWAAHLRGDQRTAVWHLMQILTVLPGEVRTNYSMRKLTTAGFHPQGPVFLDITSQYAGLNVSLR